MFVSVDYINDALIEFVGKNIIPVREWKIFQMKIALQMYYCT